MKKAKVKVKKKKIKKEKSVVEKPSVEKRKRAIKELDVMGVPYLLKELEHTQVPTQKEKKMSLGIGIVLSSLTEYKILGAYDMLITYKENGGYLSKNSEMVVYRNAKQLNKKKYIQPTRKKSKKAKIEDELEPKEKYGLGKKKHKEYSLTDSGKELFHEYCINTVANASTEYYVTTFFLKYLSYEDIVTSFTRRINYLKKVVSAHERRLDIIKELHKKNAKTDYDVVVAETELARAVAKLEIDTEFVNKLDID